MANINKAFNFKNGVSVDSDDLIVRGSLVGIGTSVPSEILDVRGTLKVVGTTTTTNLFVSGIASLTELNIVGSAITMNRSGIITAKQFYGDGSTLLNLPTSQWEDVDVGLGFTSIYAVGNVGIATRDPRYVFQVGQVNLYQQAIPNRYGIGINSQGDIISSGIFTAFSFVGFGSLLTLIDADNIDLGTLSNDRLPIIDNSKFAPNINISGVITAVQGFSGTLYGNLVGIASTALGLSGNPDIYVGLVSATSIIAQNLQITGAIGSPTLGISTISDEFNVGYGGTGFVAKVSGKVGIGVSSPTKNLQIDNGATGNTFVEVSSSSGPAIISVASSLTGGSGNLGGFLRYGSVAGEFDIYNKSTGNLNFLLHAGSSGINTGSFKWMSGQTFNSLMNLTYTGKLGLGITNPVETFHVVGTSTVTGNSYFGSNVSVNGTVQVSGTAETILGNLNSTLKQNIEVQSGISTFNNIEIRNFGRIGIGTTASCEFDAPLSTAIVQKLGIGISVGNFGIGVVAQFSGGDVVISPGQAIGIGTTGVYSGNGFDGSPGNIIDRGNLQLFNGGIRCENSNIIIAGKSSFLGIGSYMPAGAIDARYAYLDSNTRSAVYFPMLTSGERVGLSTLVETSGLIYNSSVNEFQYWNGYSWNSLSSQWVTTAAGIHTLSKVGIGTTNPTSKLTVSGDAYVTGVTTSQQGFTSGIGVTNPVKITVSGTILTFTVAGIGSTSLTLF